MTASGRRLDGLVSVLLLSAHMATCRSLGAPVRHLQLSFRTATRTDCQALLTTAFAGTSGVTHHARPLARIWNRIAHAVGDDLADIVCSGKLVWIPAHRSHTAKQPTGIRSVCSRTEKCPVFSCLPYRRAQKKALDKAIGQLAYTRPGPRTWTRIGVRFSENNQIHTKVAGSSQSGYSRTQAPIRR